MVVEQPRVPEREDGEDAPRRMVSPRADLRKVIRFSTFLDAPGSEGGRADPACWTLLLRVQDGDKLAGLRLWHIIGHFRAVAQQPRNSSDEPALRNISHRLDRAMPCMHIPSLLPPTRSRLSVVSCSQCGSSGVVQ